MPWTARELVTEGLFLSGVVSPQAQVPSGFQMTQTLRLLNRILGFKSVQTDQIPYFKYVEINNTVAGQETYFFENVAYIQSATFNYGNTSPNPSGTTVRFPMTELSANQYLAGARVNGIQSLSFSWMQQRVKGGTEVRLYFLPAQAWQLSLYCKMFIANVTLDTDLEETFDEAYIEYLRWYLAKYICLEYGIQFGPEKMQQLRELASQLQYLSAPDAMVKKVSTLQKNSALGWGFINLYDGYMPGGY